MVHQSFVSRVSLYECVTDDRLLARFLHCSDGSLERTKATLDLFFTLRANAPEFFSDRDPQALRVQQVFSLMYVDQAPPLCPLTFQD